MAIGTFGVVTNINLSKLSGIMAEPGAVPAKVMGEKGAVYLPLLGELRGEQGSCRIIPALEISTEQGVVTIPVEDIVKFKKQSQVPEQKKEQLKPKLAE